MQAPKEEERFIRKSPTHGVGIVQNRIRIRKRDQVLPEYKLLAAHSADNAVRDLVFGAHEE